jgi:lipoyl-dependent peroxiredoxin
MPIRHANATWTGTLKEGSGFMRYGNLEGAYTFASRFQSAEGTNPEELVGAAHAGCFSMFLSSLLTNAGFPPDRIDTTAAVHLEDGPTITAIELDTEVTAPGLDDATLQAKAVEAKQKCPVSKALAAIQISVTAKLVS